jgi:hypothetical protein
MGVELVGWEAVLVVSECGIVDGDYGKGRRRI